MLFLTALPELLVPRNPPGCTNLGSHCLLARFAFAYSDVFALDGEEITLSRTVRLFGKGNECNSLQNLGGVLLVFVL